MKIGIFDSGVGGLSVYKIVKKHFPKCDYIYFADTAHLPYGEKTKKTIISYTKRILHFLLKKKCNVIICACNTASSVAVPYLRKGCPVPLYDVITPVVKKVKNSKKIAIIGTKLTIKSSAYLKKIRKINPKARIFAMPTPLFVPLIEEGWTKTEVLKKVIQIYLKKLKNWNPDTLILGCTHYPVIKNQIQSFLGKKTQLIGSEAIVDDIKISSLQKKGKTLFFVSDDPKHFRKIARKIFNVNTGRVKLCTEFL
ncbi:MAG: glutamate racemase [Elusimicrobia bacterium]|nr:glutamate racemase [Elusimicrobiota bacterium]